MKHDGTVILVDDEPGMLTALTRLLEAEGFVVKSFPSAVEYLAARKLDGISCLVLDVAMPGLDGLDLQNQLSQKGDITPIIFLTGHGDIPMSVRAIKSGAVDFLTKPVKDVDLFRAVRAGLAQAAIRAAEHESTADLRKRLSRLTPREHEVMRHVIAGKPNKIIAADLGTGEQTIKIHRMRMMEKMGLSSVAALVEARARVEIEVTAVLPD